jgi:hypothetical protein
MRVVSDIEPSICLETFSLCWRGRYKAAKQFSVKLCPDEEKVR